VKVAIGLDMNDVVFQATLFFVGQVSRRISIESRKKSDIF
jgi:hypothetical protein